jgi:hypothetical protein
VTRRNRATWLYLDLYRVNLHVATNPAQLRDLRKDFELEDIGEHVGGATTGFLGDTDGVSSYHVVWWIAAGSHEPEDLGRLVNTVAHEAAHGAAAIWKWIGADIDVEILRDEPYAYLVGFLTEWLWEAAIRDVVPVQRQA